MNNNRSLPAAKKRRAIYLPTGPSASKRSATIRGNNNKMITN